MYTQDDSIESFKGKPLFKNKFFYFLISLLIILGSVYAADPIESERFNDFNEDLLVPWIELETIIKNTPQEDDLVEISLNKFPLNMKLYMDFKKLNVGKDFVIRAWMVAKSNNNAYNGSYEGFRCATQEYKVYAFFNPKRSIPLRVKKDPNWKKVRSGSYRAELMEHIFCDGLAVEQIDQIKDNLNKEYSP